MQEVRAAVIGTGVMGRKYAQMIAEGKAGALRLTAVVCRSAGAQQWAKDTLPDTVRVCPSADQLYDYAEEFDAVLVVTPHKTHPALVMQAFAHGKHVLCDKPSANALAPALEMNRAAEKSGLVFAMMFHQRRYKKYMRLKKLLDDGTLGEIKRVQLENSRYFRTWMYHRSGSWRSSWAGEGGGALLNQGQHILDIWQWLFGMPTSIYAVIPYGKYNDFMVDDEATLLMEYPQQRTATFILSTGEGSYTERLEIVGTKGTALLEDLGNLTANELYDPAGAGEAAASAILDGLSQLAAQCEHLIVVSNEVFSGGAGYAGDTNRYLKALAQVNNGLAARADAVVRVVCGIPVSYKGAKS